jgi:probable phosphoglycerate mutase
VRIECYNPAFRGFLGVSKVTLFHLVRHGEHAMQSRIIAGRTTGIGLSPKGRAEAAAVAERLTAEKVAAIYASPLDRTRETATI